jgi:hypothetical protein
MISGWHGLKCRRSITAPPRILSDSILEPVAQHVDAPSRQSKHQYHKLYIILHITSLISQCRLRRKHETPSPRNQIRIFAFISVPVMISDNPPGCCSSSQISIRVHILSFIKRRALWDEVIDDAFLSSWGGIYKQQYHTSRLNECWRLHNKKYKEGACGYIV